MNTPGTFQIHATDGAARTGVLQTAHGPVNTPIFMPVGTVGSVKAIAPDDLNAIGAEIILGNTYHLYLRPGDELVAAARRPARVQRVGQAHPYGQRGLSGLQPFHPAHHQGGRAWTFRSHLDGSKHLFIAGKGGGHPAQPEFGHHDGARRVRARRGGSRPSTARSLTMHHTLGQALP